MAKNGFKLNPPGADVKTYKHNFVLSRCLFAQFRKQADTVAPHHSNRWFAEVTLLKLQHVGEHGLPDCYQVVEDYLYDFWPDLPWDTEGLQATIKLILADERFSAIAASVKESIGIDMKLELEKGLVAS